MISHRSILVNLANKIAADDSVRDYCIAHFGRGLAVHVGAYAQCVPSADDSPFLWITPREESEDKNADEVFTARLVVGGCVTGDGGEKVITNIISERTDSANGVTVNGGNAIVENLRDLIVERVKTANAGAIVNAIRREENDIAHFPLEWATTYVEYFEPEAL